MYWSRCKSKTAAINIILLASTLFSPQAVTANDPGSRKPFNVLFISLDDLNDWVGPLGAPPGVLTPNIDRLAREGVTFSRAYTSAPSCNPARVSLLLGQRPDTTGVYYNEQKFRELLPDATTLPQAFRDAGFLTIGGGKVFHGGYDYSPLWSDNPPKGAEWHHQETNEKSWDEYHTFIDDPLPDAQVTRNGLTRKAFYWGSQAQEDQTTPDGELALWAENFLRQTQDKPFFLAVGFYRPHLPWYVPGKYRDRLLLGDIELPPYKADDLDDVPPIGKRWALKLNDHQQITDAKLWPEAIRAYIAAISFADAQLGHVLNALYDGPNADNTIVVLWSDHGMHLGEKNHWLKFTLWEESTRVPLIISVPGITAGGTKSERVVSLLDVYPTLMDLSGLPKDEKLEGRSLVPLLQKPDTPWPWPAVSVYGAGNYSIRTERWRYILYNTGEEELYDHKEDPNEWTNLALNPKFDAIREKLFDEVPLTIWDRINLYFKRF